MTLSEGTERMQEIAQSVREGAMAYLKRQYRVVIIVFAVLFVYFPGAVFL
jgi:K(+)-stimulated pyrophosphate-energized sodium pump